MELLAYDRDIEFKKQVFEIVLFLERMKTAVRGFPPELRKQVEMAPIEATAQQLRKVAVEAMTSNEPFIHHDPEGRN